MKYLLMVVAAILAVMIVAPGLFVMIPGIGLEYTGPLAMTVHDAFYNPETWVSIKTTFANSATAVDGLNSWVTMLWSPLGLVALVFLAWIFRGAVAKGFGNFPLLLKEHWLPLTVLTSAGAGGWYLYNSDQKEDLMVIVGIIIIVTMIILNFTGKVAKASKNIIGQILDNGLIFLVMGTFISSLLIALVGNVSPTTAEYALYSASQNSYLVWWAGVTKLVRTAVAPIGTLGTLVLVAMVVAVMVVYFKQESSRG